MNSAINIEWSNDMVLNFMEFYETEPVLWDPKHKDYKDKKKVNDGWVRLSRRLDIPVIELKKKKAALMATFRGHWRRKKASLKAGARAGAVYKPIWFAYAIMERFLLPVYARSSATCMDDAVASPDRLLDDDEDASSETYNVEPSTSTPPRPSVRRRANPSELQGAGAQMKEAFGILKSVVKRSRTEEDECDLFARFLANKLRRLPEDEKELFMYEIHGMFVNRTSHLSDPSFSGPRSETPSPDHHYIAKHAYD